MYKKNKTDKNYTMKITTKFTIATLAAVFLTPIAHMHAMNNNDLAAPGDNSAPWAATSDNHAQPAHHNSNQAKTTRPLMGQDLFGRVMDRVSQSSFMNRYNNWLSKTRNPYPDAPLAGEKIQQLSLNAQDAVGIPRERQVPVKYFSDNHGLQATYNGIYLDLDMTYNYFPALKNKSLDQSVVTLYDTINPVKYGNFSSCLHHEAVHIKFNHEATQALLCAASNLFSHPIVITLGVLGYGLSLSYIYNNNLPRAFSLLPYIVSYAILYQISDMLLEAQTARMERRADIEGYYATECHTCVSQRANTIHNKLSEHHYAIATSLEAMKNPTPNLTAEQASAALEKHQNKLTWWSRYLSPEEIQQIAAQLKKENKECIVHAQHRKKQE